MDQTVAIAGTLFGRGAYALLISLQAACDITAGRLGLIHFKPGAYLYIGSALGGLKGRVLRHFRPDKKHHWHIDYLLDYAHIVGVLTLVTEERLECAIASRLGVYFEGVPHFGSSDCRCHSHLFYHLREKVIYRRAVEVIDSFSNTIHSAGK
jgi:Uri superfamily endonuclease